MYKMGSSLAIHITITFFKQCLPFEPIARVKMLVVICSLNLHQRPLDFLVYNQLPFVTNGEPCPFVLA